MTLFRAAMIVVGLGFGFKAFTEYGAAALSRKKRDPRRFIGHLIVSGVLSTILAVGVVAIPFILERGLAVRLILVGFVAGLVLKEMNRRLASRIEIPGPESEGTQE